MVLTAWPRVRSFCRYRPYTHPHLLFPTHCPVLAHPWMDQTQNFGMGVSRCVQLDYEVRLAVHALILVL